jgi:molybdopterin converting factor small subunit
MFTGRSYLHASALPDLIELTPGATVEEAIVRIRRYFYDDQALSDSCLVAVSGEHLGSIGRFADRTLQEGEEIVLIAPVAGG